MADVRQLSVEELKRWREEGTAHHLIDVREPWELDICKLADAQPIPMGEVPDRISDLPTDKPLVVMCRSGGRSQRIATMLHDQGLTNAVNLAGGILAWGAAFDPEMESY